MRIFEHRNTSDEKDVCPVCKTNEDGQTVLIPIAGTEDDGLMQAKQFHLKCVDLTYMKGNQTDNAMLFQVIVD